SPITYPKGRSNDLPFLFSCKSLLRSMDHTESLGGREVFKHTISLLYIGKMWCPLRRERDS
ncbi:MAG: hypothetical protein ACN6PI_22255, partial [Sphingobacterium siyangense]